MKNGFKLCLLFFFLLSGAALAGQAELQFHTSGQERIQLLINGRLVNRSPATLIRIRERPGMHRLTIRVFNRRGFFKQELHEKVRIRPHSSSQFMVESHPYKGSRLLKLSSPVVRERAVRRLPPEVRRPYPPRPIPISDEAYLRLRDSMSRRQSDRTRLITARNGLSHQLLYARDVEDLLYLFRLESSRLTFAQWAYERVIDPENYERVYPALKETSILQLEHHLRQRY